MKKIFILLGCILLSFSLLAKKDTTQVSKKCNLYYSNCERFSHWSLYAKAGLSVFDGDAKQNYNSIIPQHAERLSLGGAVEYSFNPRWGLVADYMYLPIGADESNIKFHTEVHSPALYVSSNLSNLFYSKRKNRHWSVYANLGFALSLYKTTLERTSNPGLYIAGYVPATPTDLPYVVDDNLSFAFLFGLNVECNLNRHLALGLYTQYRMQTKDNFEGGRQWQGNTNDGILAVTLGLRYKISAGKKCHIRNIDMATYNGDKKNENDDLTARLATLENRIDSIESRVDNLESYLIPEPDDDGDGVPNSRDRHPNTPPNAYVNFWGEPLPNDVLKAAENAENYTDLNTPSVFFDFDRYVLRLRSKEIIQEVAFRLHLHPGMKVEIRGYCDSPGTDDYNARLSVNRCLAVKKELTEVHQIDESRIVINGLGKMIEPAGKYQFNRRCDFFFSR